MDFWRIVVSIILPPRGVFWQVGLSRPCREDEIYRTALSHFAWRRYPRGEPGACCARSRLEHPEKKTWTLALSVQEGGL